MFDSALLWALIAALCGTAVSILKYCFTHKLEQRRDNGFLISSLIRQAVNLFCLVGAWLIARALQLPAFAILIGMALGLTIPTILFAAAGRLRS